MAFDPDKYLRDNPPVSAPPGAMPGTEPAPDQPSKSWGDTADYYQKMARHAGNAFTFGLGDRARAVGQVLWGGGPPRSYDEALKEQVAETERNRAEDPTRAIAGEIAGGAAGALAAAPLGVTTALARTVPYWARATVGAGEAGAYGAAQGAGNTYTGNPADYVTNAGRNALLAMPFGAAAPAVGSAVGNVTRNISDRFAGGIPRPLHQAAAADAAGLRSLPPGGMLPDAGPAMLGTAQGSAVGVGPQAANLRDVLTVRNTGAGPRISQEVHQTFGPAQVPDDIVTGLRQQMQGLAPEYDRVLQGARAVDTSGLAQHFDTLIVNSRGAGQQAAREVRAMLEIPTNPGHLDPYPPAVQATRSAVRARLDALERSPDADRNVIRILTQADQELTRRLQSSVPGLAEVDAAYRRLGDQIRGVETGERVFEKGRNTVVRPVELAREFGLMTPAPPGIGHTTARPFEPATMERIREGTRAELERIVGTNRNDLASLRNVLGNPEDWNAAKLAIVFGQDRADRLMQRLATEERFRNTYTKIVENSQTAQRASAEKALDASSKKIPVEMGVLGGALRGGQEVIQWMRRGSAEGGRENVARIMATQDPQQINALIDRMLAIAPRNTRRADIARMLATQATIGGGAAAP